MPRKKQKVAPSINNGPTINVIPSIKHVAQLPPVLFPDITSFLSPGNMSKLLSTSKTLNTLANSPPNWRCLYQSHFGPLYYTGDYKPQYQAKCLLSRAEKATMWSKFIAFNTLNEHLEKYPGKSWTNYYFAHSKPNQALEYGLAALRAKDARAILFLVDWMLGELTANRSINRQHLNEFLNLVQLDETIDPQEREKYLCLINAILSSVTNNAVEKSNFKDTALDQFFQNIRATSAAVKEFLKFSFKLFKALKIDIELDFYKYIYSEELPIRDNVLEALMGNAIVYSHFSKDNVLHRKLIQWLDELIIQTNAAAMFYYAKRIIPNNDFVTQKTYYIRAVLAGDYRGAIELHQISSTHQDVISKEDGVKYVKMGAIKGNTVCINILFKEKGWINDPAQTWIMLTLVVNSEDLSDLVQDPANKLRDVVRVAMIAQSRKIEKAGLSVRCALTFIYGFEDDDREAAQEQYDIAVAGDPNIFNQFLQIGSELGIDTERYQNFVKSLEAPADSKAQKNCARR